jgi:broad specificity phosphatase PhoE
VSTLTLVRHGQADPFQKERAELTSTGQAQAASLAEYWLRHQVRFDEVYSGQLPRQVGTEQVVAERFRAAGQTWPEARRDASWNEYDAPNILKQLGGFEQLGSSRLAKVEFQKIFEQAMTTWLEGQTTTNGFEPWTAFRDRVSAAVGSIMAGPSGRRVVVFTSGGPIGFCVHKALRAPAQSFLDVNWRVRNGSVSEFIFDRERFSLDSFNGIPHLVEDAQLQTWR